MIPKVMNQQMNVQRKLNRQGGRCLSTINNLKALINIAEGEPSRVQLDEIICHALAIQHDTYDMKKDIEDINIQIGDNNIQGKDKC